MEVFKFCLARLAAISYNNIKLLECHESVDFQKQIFTAEEQIKLLAEQLCNELYHLIKKITDKKGQQRLLILKRAIYNRRVRSDENFDWLNDSPTTEIFSLLQQYLDVVQQLHLLQEKGHATYIKEIAKAREQFKTLIQISDFRNGLVLASQDLLKSATGYSMEENSALSKKSVKTELGLLKYFSRAVTKTSPFSTFTTVNIAAIEESNNQHILTVTGSGDEQYPITSKIRLNNAMLLLIRNILFKYPAYYTRLNLSINTTVKTEDGKLVFLINSGNSESFQRIDNSPLLEAIINIIREDSPTFNQLLEQLQQLTDATRTELQEYVRQLIELGLLELIFPVSGTDPFWDVKLIEHLKIFATDKPINQFISRFSLLRGEATAYESTDTTGRIKILSNAYEIFIEAVTDLHIAAGLPKIEREVIRRYVKKDEAAVTGQNGHETKLKSTKDENVFYHSFRTLYYVKPESFYYEDTTRNMHITVNKDFIKPISDLLSKINQKFSYWAYYDDEMELLKHFFLKHVGKETCVSILSFYETIYKQGVKGSTTTNVNEALLHDVPGLQQRKEKMGHVMNQLIDLHRTNNSYGGDVFHFDSNTLKVLDIPEKRRNDQIRYSFACFIQPIMENGRCTAVLNAGMAMGYGKLMSRFLHLFEEHVTEQIRNANTTASEQVIYIENTDASFFNANIHPPLMAFEIQMPGGHNSLNNNRLIPVSDILVKYDESEDNLTLIDRNTQKRIIVFDLCFEGSDNRSPLFRLLNLFSSMFPSPCQEIISLSVNEAYTALQTKTENSSESNVTVHPRIVIDNKLVVQRKRWIFTKDTLPKYESHFSEWEIFSLFSKWRKQHALPDEVFIKVRGRHENNNEKVENSNSKKYDYKPQYINFNIPMLVTLLYKSLDRIHSQLIVEEMLPVGKEILPVNKNQFVSELFVQWYE